MMPPRAKGHTRTGRVSPHAVPHARILGVTIANPYKDHLLPSTPTDQGVANSCCGFGFYKGPVETWAAARGIACDPISALAGYTGGRQALAPNDDTPLLDFGTDPSRVMDFAKERGLVPEAVLPYTDDPDVVAQRIDPFSLEVGALFHVRDFAMLEDLSDEALVQLLAQDIPLPFGMDVGATYEAILGDVVYEGPPDGEPSAGGHAQYLSGYRWNPAAGRFEFRITGSWRVWGNGGFVWTTGPFLRSARAFDIAAMRFTQVVRKAAA